MLRGGKVSRMAIQSRNFYAGYWHYSSTLNVLIQHRKTFPPVYENVYHARNFSTAEHLPFTVCLGSETNIATSALCALYNL